jgi:nucleotide-binding universal stress UspA family protein
MLRISEAADQAAVEPFAPPPGGFIVATDGTPASDGAVRVGCALAQRGVVSTSLLSVVEPPPVFDLEGESITDVHRLTAIAREARGALLLTQRDRTHPGIHHWPYTVDTGPRVETIIKRATAADAALIILGLGAHGLGSRLTARETALRVIRAAATPVLAVPSDAWGVPHSALAAVDFTESSVGAARASLDLLGDEGTLYIAHAMPRVPIPQGDSRTWDEITTSAVTPKLEAVVRQLDPSPGIQVEYVLLHGDPARELLAFAEHRRVDMIAAGSHGRSALGRLMLGSVSTKLVRTANCWVLIAPARPAATGRTAVR